MAKLLVIADDFTGSMDTGVQFATRGADTRVVLWDGLDFSWVSGDADVLVINTDTRHLQPEEAYQVVYQVAKRALQKKIPFIYKKTDSALRGNIGSELSAVVQAAKTKQIIFVPAYPKINRITQNGIHYIDGIPVSKSMFGHDPFNPVHASALCEIIMQQTAVPTILHGKNRGGVGSVPGIHLFDAETDEDMTDIAKHLNAEELRFSAGCAGFAAVLASHLGFREEIVRFQPDLSPHLFVVCGSMNPVTVQQLLEAEKQEFVHIRMTKAQKLDPEWISSLQCTQAVKTWVELAEKYRGCILDVNNEEDPEDLTLLHDDSAQRERLRTQIAERIGILTKRLLDAGLKSTILCIGGDTMQAILQAIGIKELQPVCELYPGVVLNRFRYKTEIRYIISKSGGIGKANLICKVASLIEGKD